MNRVLAKGLYHCRSFVMSRHAMLACAGAAALLVHGSFSGLQFTLSFWPLLAALALMMGLLLFRLTSRRPAQNKGRMPRLESIETGLVALTCIYIVIQITGGTESVLQPLVYLGLVVLIGFNERWVGFALALLAIGLQATLHLAAGELPHLLSPLLTQVGFIITFSLCGLIFLQLEVAQRRRDLRRQIATEVESMREEARDFRLISSSLATGENRDRAADEAKLAQGAVETIHHGMYFVLELLKKSLDLQTSVLLWLDSSEDRLLIKELVTDSNMVREIPLSAHAGVLGGVVKNRLLLNLRRPPHGTHGVPYYGGPEDVGAFAGVPVIEDGHLRGVLCADRRDDRPFSEAEEHLLIEAARQVLRAIQTERIFATVERSKYEHERFYQASSMLNSALTLREVYNSALSAAEEIVSFDFGAVTLHDRKHRKHIICRAKGFRSAQFEGQRYRDNAGLVAMVVKNKHFLPAGKDLSEKETMVFTRKLKLKGMQSLLVLPFIVKDEAIGTFVLAARSAGAFTKNAREMLGVITNHVAVAVENAKMYKKMEEMATTDPLTGLPNRRTFQERLEEMISRAARNHKPLTIVMTDIDKFKSVNDTYGHSVGDTVLKRFSKVMVSEARKVDVVARYGGEEFVMILEDTDSDGALLFCERLREEVSAQIMNSDHGSFRVTLSLGIAAYPADGTEQQQLVDRADQALYAAKEGGRNRSVRFCEMSGGAAAATRATVS